MLHLFTSLCRPTRSPELSWNRCWESCLLLPRCSREGFLRRLLDLLCKANHPHRRIRVTREVRKDRQTGLTFLSSYNARRIPVSWAQLIVPSPVCTVTHPSQVLVRHSDQVGFTLHFLSAASICLQILTFTYPS